MGKRVTRGSSGAWGTAHEGALRGWRWKRGVGSEHGQRATTPWGLTAPAHGHRQNWGQRQRWSTPNKHKRICCSGKDWQKRCEKSWASAYQMCRGSGRLEGNICWLPLGKDNWENQTGSYYNIGHNRKVNKQRVRLGVFFLTKELNSQSIISDGLSMSNKKCNGSEKPYIFGEYFGLCPFGELYLFGGYLSFPCHAAPQFASLWAAA